MPSKSSGNQQIGNNFSNAAKTYDSYSQTHRKILIDLLEWSKTDLSSLQSMLEVGMGTGWAMEIFKSNFPKIDYVGMDLALGMVKEASLRKAAILPLNLVQADAQYLPFEKNTFDLYFSSGTLHWCKDLEKAFKEGSMVLKKGGILLGNTFGPKTLEEIHLPLPQLAKESGKEWISRAPQFPSVDEINKGLEKSGFKDIRILEKLYFLNFNSPIEGLRAMKSLGVKGFAPNGNGIWEDGVMLKKVLKKLTPKKGKDFKLTFHLYFWEGLI